MLINVAADPGIVSRQAMEDPFARLNIEALFRGVLANGLIICDPQGRIRSRLSSSIAALPSGVGRTLNLLWPEILKKGRRRCVSCRDDLWLGDQSADLREVAARLCLECDLDCVVTTAEWKSLVLSQFCRELPVVALGEYLDHALENKRRRMIESLPPIDMLPGTSSLELPAFDEVVVRTTRFSKWLRFYDKQIGKASDNLPDFVRGIAHIVNLWLGNRHFQDYGDCPVEIITGCQSDVHAYDDAQTRQRKLQGNTAAALMLEENFRKPLSRICRLDVKLSIKADPMGLFHPRHLQTQQAAVLFERGFDLFRGGGKLKRAIVKLDDGSHQHLDELWRLPAWEASMGV